MSTPANCPCDAFNFPAVVSNPPGLSAIAYRAGDFSSFREALLRALPGEVELANWKPTTTSDLALQMIEWFAYLADILTFYNQRIANQDYLRTADLAASVNRLIRVLGYRPRPGIGAAATLAALISAKLPVTVPAGFAVQSKPGPGQQPQIFELTTDSIAQPGGDVSADPDNSLAPLGADGSVLLQGTVSSLKTGDLVLLVESGWNGTDSNYVVANVVSIAPAPTPRGTKNTRVVLGTGALPLPAGAIAANYRLLRSTQTARLFQYGVSLFLSLVDNGTTGTADLDSVARQIKPGDLILFDAANGQTGGPIAGPPIPSPPPRFGFLGGEFGYGGDIFLEYVGAREFGGFHLPSTVLLTAPPFQLAQVNTYTENIWYANNPTNPSTAPSSNPIPVLHSEITFTPPVTEDDATSLVIRYGWQDAGVLIPPPAITFSGNVGLLAVTPSGLAPGNQSVLLQDANGAGSAAQGFVASNNTGEMQLSSPLAAPLAAPIDVLTNLLPFTRGQTVPNEVLGSGDATQAGQEFILAKSPLTYLLSGDSSSGSNYTSTLRVWVNGVEWTEQPSFYGQPADAPIFVTREDENNVTHVQFGDGVNGARLPTGAGNVVATYRYGSGAAAPPAGALTVVVKPVPGLASIDNPVAAGGGADPEPSSQIRKYAPLSVMTFGRAISGDDYAAIAASTPGVARAAAVWSFDPLQQRTVVTVYVGDDAAAQSAALTALRGDADPNRPVIVQLATRIPLTIALTVEVDPRYVVATVLAAVTAALTDPDTGVFGANRIGIGEVIYRSRIFAACLSVPGAVAVHSLTVAERSRFIPFAFPFVLFRQVAPFRFDPGPGGYFFVDPASGLSISAEVSNA